MGIPRLLIHGRPARVLFWLLWCCGIGLMLAGTPAAACGIDGIPSMAMNARLVTINHAQATKDNLPYWAPFLLGTARPGTGLHFTEDAAKLHSALSEQAFATPFTWSFGDGATARGLAVGHRYSRAGWYRIDVSYYYTPQQRWIVFDSAELHLPGTAVGQPASTQIAWPIGGAALSLGALAFALSVMRRQRTVRTERQARAAHMRGRTSGH